MMHALRRRRMPLWISALLIVGMVLCMPLWIPVVVVVHAVRKYRLRKVANAFACVNCGQTLGAGAVALADKAWAQHVRALMRENPGVRFRLLRTLHGICPGCGTRYTFREHDRTFVIEPLDEPPATAQAPTTAAAANLDVVAAAAFLPIHKFLAD